MFRIAFFLALGAGLLCTAAYHADVVGFGDRSGPVNSTQISVGTAKAQQGNACDESAPIDTLAHWNILMLNYCAYDSAYAGKIHRLIQAEFPASAVTDFWDGSPENFEQVLENQDAVVLAYPFGGNPSNLVALGKLLLEFVNDGGSVILTGTHEYSVLQQLGLIDLDFGYFCQEMPIRELNPEHPILSGTRSTIRLSNMAYPLDISDPGFVSLAQVNDYPVIGYKQHGAGKVVYIGLEYYFMEKDATTILANSIRWAARARSASAAVSSESWSTRSVKRVEENLFIGSGNTAKNNVFDLKIFPNPYASEGFVDVNLSKSSQVQIEMTDETGRIVSVLLPLKQMNAGSYRFELPNIASGVYFVQCKAGDSKMVKKVVKVSSK